MLKALLKKQLYEILSVYSGGNKQKKGGKKKKNISTPVLIAILAVSFVSVAFAFYGMSLLFADSFIGEEYEWMYFAIMGIITVFVGTFGSVLTTYNTLYKAKDNELLLAMPVTPSALLFCRMVGVYISALVYCIVCWVPTVLCYVINGSASISVIIIDLLLLFILTLFVTILGCILGWIVAEASSRLSGNKVVTAVISAFAIFGIYYIIYFRLNSILTDIAENGAEIAAYFKKWLYPIYQLGLAGMGKFIPLIIFSAIVIILFSLVYLILSKTFFNLMTNNRGRKAKKFRSDDIKRNSISGALLGRELKHFISSPAMLMNLGIGLLILPIGGILILVKSAAITEALSGFSEQIAVFPRFLPAIVIGGCLAVVSMNAFSACSVSLEGNSLWILRSLPVDAREVFLAKEKMHIYLNIVPAVIFTVCAGIGLKINGLVSVLMCLPVIAYIILMSVLGLYINIRHPKFDWVNEAIPIKQGFATTICLFGGWGFSIVTMAVSGALCLVHPVLAVVVLTAAFIVIAYLIQKRIMKDGVEIFNTLG